MGIQTVDVAVVFVLSVLLGFSEHAQLVNAQTVFSYPSFPIQDGSILTPTTQEGSILKSAVNTIYNSWQQSYDMTAPVGPLPGTAVEMVYVCGRIVYKDKVQMVNRASGKVASFSTSFTFSFHSANLYSTFGYCGYGMVFTFAASPNISDVELNRVNGMCTYDVKDTSPSNSVFAVKFLSYSFDKSNPSDSTIGLVISNKGNTTETQYNLCLNSTSRDIRTCSLFCGDSGDFTAWIDYDSTGQTLEVRFRSGSMNSGGKPADALLTVNHVSLYDILNDEMYVGFSSSSQKWKTWPVPLSTETHRISSWNFNSSGVLNPAPSSSPLPSPPSSASPVSSLPTPLSGTPAGISESPPPKPSSLAALIGVICALGLGAVLVGLGLFCYFKRHRGRQREFTAGLTLDTNNSRGYTFKELSSMTKNFSDSELLSSGSFGDVFKGTPPGSGALVAVKRIKHTAEHGQASFLAEVTSLRQIRHRNLLQLRGWCEAKEGLFLVYDFMCNGSLDQWLHPSPSPKPGTSFDGLSWNVRRSILAGVASGLEYLHEEWVQCVLHRDVKSSNVMLDAEFNPYLGDFGLARLVEHHKMQKTTLLAGTLGYMAPEMMHTGRATKETDVYAYGILVLEVVCARRPLDMQGVDPGECVLLDRVWREHELGNISKIVDPRLVLDNQPETDVSEDLKDVNAYFGTFADVLQLGLWCCLPNPSDRPSMRLVNQWFQSGEKGVMENFPSLPPSKPAPADQTYVSMPAGGTTSSSQSTSTDVTQSV